MSEIEDNSFKCKFCHESFATIHRRVVHEMTHTGVPYRTCRYCPKVLPDDRNLVAHERIHTGEKPYLCMFCGKTFSTRKICHNHEKLHSGRKPYKCKFCHKCFSRLSNCTRHEKIHSEEKAFKCKNCGKNFSQRGLFTVHKEGNSDGIKLHQCGFCGGRKFIASSIPLTSKKSRCQPTASTSSNPSDSPLSTSVSASNRVPPFYCSPCDQQFESESSFNEHTARCTATASHAGTLAKFYKCGHCGKMYSSQKVLSFHENNCVNVRTEVERSVCDRVAVVRLTRMKDTAINKILKKSSESAQVNNITETCHRNKDVSKEHESKFDLLKSEEVPYREIKPNSPCIDRSFSQVHTYQTAFDKFILQSNKN